MCVGGSGLFLLLPHTLATMRQSAYRRATRILREEVRAGRTWAAALPAFIEAACLGEGRAWVRLALYHWYGLGSPPGASSSAAALECLRRAQASCPGRVRLLKALFTLDAATATAHGAAKATATLAEIARGDRSSVAARLVALLRLEGRLPPEGMLAALKLARGGNLLLQWLLSQSEWVDPRIRMDLARRWDTQGFLPHCAPHRMPRHHSADSTLYGSISATTMGCDG